MDGRKPRNNRDAVELGCQWLTDLRWLSVLVVKFMLMRVCLLWEYPLCRCAFAPPAGKVRVSMTSNEDVTLQWTKQPSGKNQVHAPERNEDPDLQNIGEIYRNFMT